MRQVFLLGQDISEYVMSIPDIVINAGEFGQLTINDLPSMQGSNLHRFWDQSNPACPFYGARKLSNYTVEIYNNGVLVFEGIMHSIKSNNQAKTATITLKSNIQIGLDKGVIYSSREDNNPAAMIRRICVQYEIPYSSSSFSTASAIYELDEVRTTAYLNGEGTVLDAIQQICEVGMARVYSQDNRLYMDVYTVPSEETVFTISDKSLRDTASERRQGITALSHPEIQTSEKEPVLGYRINFVGDPAGGVVSFGSETEQGKTIDGSYSSPIRIMTRQSAIWIGDRWIDYLGKAQQIINCSIPSIYGKILQIGYPIKIQYRNHEYYAKIISINKSLKLETKIGALTV